jgi:hypothetical protein
MVSNFQHILWKQFGAAIDMLRNAIIVFPEESLSNGSKQFYISYHTILFLDYYLTIPPTQFVSQLPFTIMPQEKIPEESIDDIMPDRIYTKTELLDYLQSAKDKCRRLLANLSEENFEERWITEPDESGCTFDYELFCTGNSSLQSQTCSASRCSVKFNFTPGF